MTYLPPDEIRYEYADLCETKHPTLNQKIKMWDVEREFPRWCKNVKILAKHKKKKKP